MLCFPSFEKNGERKQTPNQSTVLEITDRDFIQTGSKQRQKIRHFVFHQSSNQSTLQGERRRLAQLHELQNRAWGFSAQGNTACGSDGHEAVQSPIQAGERQWLPEVRARQQQWGGSTPRWFSPLPGSAVFQLLAQKSCHLCSSKTIY